MNEILALLAIISCVGGLFSLVLSYFAFTKAIEAQIAVQAADRSTHQVVSIPMSPQDPDWDWGSSEDEIKKFNEANAIEDDSEDFEPLYQLPTADLI